MHKQSVKRLAIELINNQYAERPSIVSAVWEFKGLSLRKPRKITSTGQYQATRSCNALMTISTRNHAVVHAGGRAGISNESMVLRQPIALIQYKPQTRRWK
jgi:hypothetical protein